MASTNEEVAALLREYAELLGLTGGDLFRVRSYEKAAKAVGGYPDDLAALPETALTKMPGVGKSVAARSPVPAHRDDQVGRRPAGQGAAGRHGAREGARRRPQARTADRRRLGITSVAELPRRCGRQAGGCPGSARRARSASCAASRWRWATPRCARPCARCPPTPPGRHLRGAGRPRRTAPAPGSAEAGGGLRREYRNNRGSMRDSRARPGGRTARRPTHAHRPHRRHRAPGGNDRGGRGPGLRVLRGHRPRAEPGHAADDRREDARPARPAARAR